MMLMSAPALASSIPTADGTSPGAGDVSALDAGFHSFVWSRLDQSELVRRIDPAAIVADRPSSNLVSASRLPSFVAFNLALPYLEATSGLNAGQLSFIVAAVLLGSVISTLFAGLLADWMGRKPLMTLSGITFVVSIPIIALAHGYGPLFFGRLLQGISGGLIGVVVPLYLAECLAASNRGKGTGIFQWLLTLGIVAAALIGIYYSYRVEAVIKVSDAATVFAFKDQAWRRIFWVSLPPGVLFVIGTFLVAESPRWLFRRGKKQAALAALLRSRTPEQANFELSEMEQAALAAESGEVAGGETELNADNLFKS